ncbi:MAG: alpha,alpha-phosphotrehalase [Acholeplasmataceae bacterium]|jgi:glycosidase|nr:alpha,alpha-phosphotrehalase [Acholeplasmataceae bacterium]
MWWKHSVVYEIYPRSFKDSNNDGIGDINGIISKLDYLEYLGINVIWLCPVYPTPNKDNGYDISDYMNINPEFGTLDAFNVLIKEAKKRGINIMMDIVANHTSSDHKWFKEAKKSRDNTYHNYYVFKDSGDAPPSDLQSIFLNSAWTYNKETKEYYLHMFDEDQPDLNWHYQPVREEIYKMLQYWIDLGIKGFRFDVIDLIAKEIDDNIIGDGPLLHEYIKEMSKKVLKKAHLITVGEAWGATPEKAKMYSNPDQSEFSMIFNFQHSLLDQEPDKEKWDLKELDLLDLKKVFNEQQTELYNKGWNSLFWNNHDLPRIVSRWGNDQHYHIESAKMLATLLHFMQGTPYIYQGEEIGMTNNVFESIEDYRDIETLNMIKDRLNKDIDMKDILESIRVKGRDNARTPFQWNESKYAGFSEHKPWIEVNQNYKTINAEQQMSDKNSILEHYRKLISFRRKSNYKEIIEKGSFKMMFNDSNQIFAYERQYFDQKIIVLCNFYSNSLQLPREFTYNEVICNNYEVTQKKVSKLRPYESIVLDVSNQ